jgi:hypothetical protein
VSTVFADAWFYLAVLDAGDHSHDAATDYLRGFDGDILTTRWVLVEVANGLSSPRFRARVPALLASVEENRRVRIVEDSDALYEAGRALFDARPDKEWSMTDCISFVVMEREELREALTGDRHFEQAGFVALFAE